MNLRGFSDRHRELVLQLLSRGWTIRRGRGGHYKLSHPSGKTVVVSRSPSDHRAWLNLRASIRRIEKGGEP